MRVRVKRMKVMNKINNIKQKYFEVLYQQKFVEADLDYSIYYP